MLTRSTFFFSNSTRGDRSGDAKKGEEMLNETKSECTKSWKWWRWRCCRAESTSLRLLAHSSPC